jgi:hypothetical protein
LAFVILAAALAFLADPFGIAGKKAEKRKKEEISVLLLQKKVIENVKNTLDKLEVTGSGERKTREMTADFQALQEFLTGAAGKKEKIEKCREFSDKYSNLRAVGDNDTLAVPGEITKIREMYAETAQKQEQLREELRRSQEYIAAVKKYMENRQYDKAAEALAKAEAIEKTAETAALTRELETKRKEYETQNGKGDYDAIKDQIDLARLLNFRKKYPGSVYQAELVERLNAAEGNLPPEKYWHETLQKNKKGYYEFTFGQEYNNHRMIYLIFIDPGFPLRDVYHPVIIIFLAKGTFIIPLFVFLQCFVPVFLRGQIAFGSI